MDWGFFYVVVLSAIEIYGDFALRFYAQTNKVSWLVQGLAGYAGVIYYLIQSFRYKNVLYVNGMWAGVSTLLVSLAAFVVLGDRLEKTSEYTGLIMILVGVYLLKNGF